MINEEVWKDIDNFPNYEVSNLGQIRNKKTNRILKPATTKHGYQIVCLRKDNKTTTRSVHSIVARTFVENTNPNLNKEVHHLDHDKTNNKAENLKWVSRAENLFFGTSEDQVYANYLAREIIKLIKQYKDNTNLSVAVPEILLYAEDCLATNSTYKNMRVEYR